MVFDIIEALSLYYKDDKEAMIESLLWLKNMNKSQQEDKYCTNQINEYLEENLNVCCECGTPLETVYYEELHTELDYPCYETLVEIICPKCERDYYNNLMKGSY